MKILAVVIAINMRFSVCTISTGDSHALQCIAQYSIVRLGSATGRRTHVDSHPVSHKRLPAFTLQKWHCLSPCMPHSHRQPQTVCDLNRIDRHFGFLLRSWIAPLLHLPDLNPECCAMITITWNVQANVSQVTTYSQ